MTLYSSINKQVSSVTIAAVILILFVSSSSNFDLVHAVDPWCLTWFPSSETSMSIIQVQIQAIPGLKNQFLGIPQDRVEAFFNNSVIRSAFLEETVDDELLNDTDDNGGIGAAYSIV